MKKVGVIFLVVILLFNTLYTRTSYANPVVIPAAVGGAIAVGALAAASATAMKGVSGFEDDQTVWDIANTIQSTADAARMAALSQAAISAVEAGANTINFAQETLDWWKAEFKKNALDYAPTFTDEQLSSLGLYLESGKKIRAETMFHYVKADGTFNNTFTLRLDDGPNYIQLISGSSVLVYQYANFEAYLSAYNNADTLSEVFSLIVAIGSANGYTITVNDRPIDNWGEEVDRLLQNVFGQAVSLGVPANLADVIATTLDGTQVRWDNPTKTWTDPKGIAAPLPLDTPVTDVKVQPRSQTGVENPPAVPTTPTVVLPADAVATISDLTTFFNAIRAKIDAKYPFIPVLIGTYNVTVNSCSNWSSLSASGLKVGSVTLGNLKIVDATYINGISSKIKFWIGGIIWFFLGLYIIRKLASIWGSTR